MLSVRMAENGAPGRYAPSTSAHDQRARAPSAGAHARLARRRYGSGAESAHTRHTGPGSVREGSLAPPSGEAAQTEAASRPRRALRRLIGRNGEVTLPLDGDLQGRRRSRSGSADALPVRRLTTPTGLPFRPAALRFAVCAADDETRQASSAASTTDHSRSLVVRRRTTRASRGRAGSRSSHPCAPRPAASHRPSPGRDRESTLRRPRR